MLEMDPKIKKTNPEVAVYESELDDEFIERYLQMMDEKEKKQNETKLIKENEKRRANGEEELTEWPEEKKVRKPIMDMERLEKKHSQLEERIKAMKTNLIDKVIQSTLI